MTQNSTRALTPTRHEPLTHAQKLKNVPTLSPPLSGSVRVRVRFCVL